MNGRRVEVPHHTAEQVSGYMDEAIRMVADLGIHGALGEALVLKAVDLLAAKHITVEQVQGPVALGRLGSLT